MKVEYSNRAVSDLEQIADYHAPSDDSKIGERVEHGIRACIAAIARLPERGRPVIERPGVRVVLLLQYRYKIFYRTGGATIRIIHIRHTSRQPWPAD